VVAHRGKALRPAGTLPLTHGGIADSTLFIEYFSSAEVIVRDGVPPLPEQPQGASVWIAGN